MTDTQPTKFCVHKIRVFLGTCGFESDMVVELNGIQIYRAAPWEKDERCSYIAKCLKKAIESVGGAVELDDDLVKKKDREEAWRELMAKPIY